MGLPIIGLAMLIGLGGDDPAFKDEVRPFLADHCVKCHNADKKKGGVDLSGDQDVRRSRKLWRNVIDQVEALEMPPTGEPGPAPERRDRVLSLLKASVASFDCGDLASIDPGPPLIRRLTRDEYDRTIRDLLGVEGRPGEAVGMPADGSGSGFSNMAEGLILPPVLMEKYFEAADKILARPEVMKTLMVAVPDENVTPRAAARTVIATFLPRAYRRPVGDEEIGRFLSLFDRSIAHGSTFETSVRLMAKSALVSPHFLFRVERDRPAKAKGEASVAISDHDLAVRLSYFLWSTMPDATLFGLADQGKLSAPATLEGQVRRMLADPRARAMTENFAEQWLQLDKVARARPSTEFFPTFTGSLRQAFHDETASFFDHLRTEDRSVLEFLEADYAYLNQDLARHYDIPGVDGSAIRRVTLPRGSHRGGLLGMGSMLAATSHTSRTSPTLRGKWILEVVFGTPPPPPPPDAGKLPEGEAKGAAPQSFREQMARHSRQAECASCHARIDPLGYGLENFDAVGRWRVESGGKPVDSAGKLPGGEAFEGADQLKGIVLARRDDFERNLVERMMSYAMGRDVQGDDECSVRDIQKQMREDQHKFSRLVLGVARSVPFQRRRPTEDRGVSP